MIVRMLVVLGGLLAAVTLSAAPSYAHANLLETDPADGAELDTAPSEVTVIFDEGVELPEGGLRVFDAEAERVDTGIVDTGSDATVAAGLPEDLPDGGYLVVYRVMSTDSHPISGVVGFTVGDGLPVSAGAAQELIGGGDELVGFVGSAVRGLGYLATLLTAGAALFALVVARTDRDRRSARRIGVPAAGVAVAVALVAWPLQTMAVTGYGPAEALRLSVLGDTLTSSFGQSWLLRVAALAVLIAVWQLSTSRWAAALAGLTAVGSFVIDGHQRSVEPTALLHGADMVHVTAGALWFGGLVLLGVTVWARSLDDDPVGAADLVARFSTAALWSVVGLAVSGLAMGWVLVRTPAALTGTDYGLLLLAKLALVVLAVAAAGYNRLALVPAISARTPAGGSTDADLDAPVGPAATSPRARAAWRRLGGTLGVEALLLIGVLLVTGFLVVTRPAAEEAGVTGLYDTRVAVTDDLDLDVVVDPNEAGRINAIHLYALDATGRPAADVEELELQLTYEEQGIGPFDVQPFPAGPGHWVANVDELTFPGDWTFEVTVAVDRFTEERVTFTVPVS